MELAVIVDEFKIPTLRDLCMKVSFKSLLCKASPTTAEFLRDRINNQLAGIVNQEFGDRCLDELNANYFTSLTESENKQLVSLDVVSILDCILDESFIKLEIQVPLQTVRSFSSLLSVICRRSPRLNDLVMKFYKVSDLLDETSTDEPNSKKRKVEPYCSKTSDSSNSHHLHDLTSLSLLYEELYEEHTPLLLTEDSPRQSILSTVGELCPALVNVTVHGFCLRKSDILGLIVGDFADVLFTSENEGWSKDSTLENLWIPKEVQKPLCSSLQVLEIFCSNFSSCFCYDSFPRSAYISALRHLRNLKSAILYEFMEESPRLSVNNPTLFQLLTKERVESQQREFEESCLAAAAFIGSEIKSTLPLSYFSGPLSLTSLVGIQIDDIEMMRNLGIILPNLEKVEFVGGFPLDGRNNLNAHSEVSMHSSLSNDEVGSILKKWQNVKSITIKNIQCSECIKTILNTLGPALKSLDFMESQLNLAQLIPCCNLERLTIFDGCSVTNDGAVGTAGLISLQYLPVLKSFSSSVCLGEWSPLFESKTSLTELGLNCSHIGIGDVPRLEWSQAPDYWPGLKKLELGVCSGLSLTMLAEHFSKLTSLQHAILPDTIVENESDKLIDVTIARFWDNQTCWMSFDLSGYLATKFNENCTFQPDQDDESDDESIDESDDDLSEDSEDDV